MLFIDSPVTAKSMEEWLLADGYSKHKVSIDRLLQLRVFLEVNDRYGTSNSENSFYVIIQTIFESYSISWICHCF